MKKFLISLLVALTVSSCATQTFSIDSKVKREVPSGNPHFSQRSNFFVSGIGQSDFRNAGELCKENGGASFVEVKQTFGQVLLALVTYGIYTPRTMNIYCSKE